MTIATQLIDSTIVEAYLNLMVSDESISIFTMVTEMQRTIIGIYDGTPLQDYINRWNNAIAKHFKSKNIDLVSYKTNLEMIVYLMV